MLLVFNLQDSTKDSSKGFPMKDRIGPLISRISPVLKRKTLAQSPSKEAANDSYVLEASAEMSHATSRDTTKEDLENMSSCSIDGSLVLSDGRSMRTEDSQTCLRCKVLETDYQQLQEEKVQLDKQLVKAREEAQMLSELIKDMERKWTDVAKDYEKQVSSFPTHCSPSAISRYKKMCCLAG